MPDQPVPDRPYGLGAIQSPPDDRDYQITDLTEMQEHLAAAAELPAKYTVPNLPAILDQGNTPMCVAFSSSAMKTRQDQIDTGKVYDLNESLFFRNIGGTSNGAVMRAALERMRLYGYPDISGNASLHKIAAYYAVEKNLTVIKTAISQYGAILMLGPWYNNWIYGVPSNGVLTRPDYGGNGHAVMVIGWDDAKGLQFQNSWGPAWAVGGRAWMPYYYVINTMWEFWKTLDVKTGSGTATWKGRVRAGGIPVNIREKPDWSAASIYAQTRPDGDSPRNPGAWTHKVTNGKWTSQVLWTWNSQYLYSGKKVSDGKGSFFLEIKTGAGKILYIHQSVAVIVVAP